MLIVENERLTNSLANATFDSNDVISYLKKQVEDEDAEVVGEETDQRAIRVQSNPRDPRECPACDGCAPRLFTNIASKSAEGISRLRGKAPNDPGLA